MVFGENSQPESLCWTFRGFNKGKDLNQSRRKYIFFKPKVVQIDCMFLSCHVYVSEWIHSIVAWMSRNSLLGAGISDCPRNHNHLVHKQTLNHLAKLANLAKWLSIRLRTKWCWVGVQLYKLSCAFNCLVQGNLTSFVKFEWNFLLKF